jgi:plasmid stability protein
MINFSFFSVFCAETKKEGEPPSPKLLLTWCRISAIMALYWSKNRGKIMPVTLSIKNAQDDVVKRLKARAARNHRSVQGELLAIIEEAVRNEAPVSPGEVLAEVRRLGLRTPSESAQMVREDRDGR